MEVRVLTKMALISMLYALLTSQKGRIRVSLFLKQEIGGSIFTAHEMDLDCGLQTGRRTPEAI
jgi:hypothetical protein